MIGEAFMNVGILIFPGVEVLDFTGPFETFSVATRVAKRDRVDASYKAFFVAENSGILSARYDFLVKPHYGFADHPHIDLLLIPGGIMEQPRSSATTIDWIKRSAESSQLVTSVCTGAFLLAQAGLLHGLKATTHWEDIDDLRREFPAIDVVENQAWVDAARVVTSAGISAGIDMSLHLVARLHGEPLACATARQMVYHWHREPTRVYAPSGFA
jgi:transcriptional regulator GlxA family with amidase domain